MDRKRIPVFLVMVVLFLIAVVVGAIIVANALPSLTSPRAYIGPVPVAKGHDLNPIASNQWYSNIYAQFPTEPLYALPAAFELAPEGVGIGLPDVHKTANTVFAPYITDLRAGFAQPLQKPTIQDIGDWSISLEMQTAEHASLNFTLAQGAPFIVLHVDGASLQLTCAVSCQVYTNNAELLTPGHAVTAQTYSLVVRGHTYLVSLDTVGSIQLVGTTLTLQRARRVYLAAMPNRAAYSLFQTNTATEIVGTQATPAINGNMLTTAYTLATHGPAPLIALLPHQWDNLATNLPRVGKYATIRGSMTLVQTSTFATTLPLDVPATDFTPLRHAIPTDLSTSLQHDIESFLATGPPASHDYYLGVWFGRGADLLQLAMALGYHTLEQRLLKYMEPLFAQSMNDFAYSPAKTSVIANDPEFGNEKLNDHHFHYGYYIRTAAVLAMLDPAFLAPMPGQAGRVNQTVNGINHMVADIGTFDRTSSQFPYLRTFDVYEGHSWADGFAAFADGNNQESTSEAIQAWYGLYLWSQVTHNSGLETTALYLYNTEIVSTREYWFGQNGLYTAPYQHAIASIVWGGKVDFATWFSDNPNEIYGIQLLPFTPASAYLGQFKDLRPYIADLQAHGGESTGMWGDLLIIWEAYYSPQAALAKKDSVPAANWNSPHSLLLYLLYAKEASK